MSLLTWAYVSSSSVAIQAMSARVGTQVRHVEQALEGCPGTWLQRQVGPSSSLLNCE